MQNKRYAFARSNQDQAITIACNFSPENGKNIELEIPMSVNKQWRLSNGRYPLVDKLNQQGYLLEVTSQRKPSLLRLI
ncbi:hypothetical protein [Vibrio sp. TRT 1302]|uniref:hypothetical protein n=1 Tax=Vibrio sp. TRT 1302 TaxID=3418504 RepID=UPI003CEC0718